MRIPPKSILVPMDLSEPSMLAWRQAAMLARRFDARLQALYVQEWFYTALGTGVGAPIPTADAAQASIEALQERLGPDADVRTVTGLTDRMIVSWAERGWDLIVMGSHGRTGFDRLVRGSVAEAVVHVSSVPVLVVHDYEPELKTVLAPVEPMPYSLEGLKVAARFAAAHGARLTALHVVSAPVYRDPDGLRGTKMMIEDMLAELPGPLRDACRPGVELAFGDPAREIAAASRDYAATVLVARARGFLHDRVLGTTAERVLRYSRRLVLAVPVQVPSAPRLEAPARGPRALRAHRA